jgi:hypothetical protein
MDQIAKIIIIFSGIAINFVLTLVASKITILVAIYIFNGSIKKGYVDDELNKQII